jgi:hypothetical protein
MISSRRYPPLALVAALALSACADPSAPPTALPPLSPLLSHTPAPTWVTVPGSFQNEVGCPSDWDPACPNTHLAYDAEDGVWQGSFVIPSGSWEYKVALDNSWTENYGLNAIPNGPNLPLNLPAGMMVKFYYSHATHWVADNVSRRIATVPGSFQSELGCAGDWDPSCLRSWLQDPDGDQIYEFVTAALPAGSYEAKVAIDESWAENYGAGGVPNGANIPFTVPSSGTPMRFLWNSFTNLLTITAETTDPTSVAIDVLPDDSPNVINHRRLLITVALLGSASFDVSDVDVATLRFGPSGAEEVHDLSNAATLAGHVTDVNGDGFPDLVMHFRTAATGLTTTSTSGCLSGESAGAPFAGCDALVVK